MAETDTVVHLPDRSRFVLRRGDEELGKAIYERRPDGAYIFVHTEIDENVQEKGLGGELVRQALEQLRASSDERVVATCPFVAHYLETHPEFDDLGTRGSASTAE